MDEVQDKVALIQDEERVLSVDEAVVSCPLFIHTTILSVSLLYILISGWKSEVWGPPKVHERKGD